MAYLAQKQIIPYVLKLHLKAKSPETDINFIGVHYKAAITVLPLLPSLMSFPWGAGFATGFLIEINGQLYATLVVYNFYTKMFRFINKDQYFGTLCQTTNVDAR